MSRSTIRGAMRKNGYTTQWFLQLHDVSHRSLQIAPGVSSRLSRVSLYVINDARLPNEERNLPQIVIGKFKEHRRAFSRLLATGSSFAVLGLSAMNVPGSCAHRSEGVMGAIHHQGYCPIP